MNCLREALPYHADSISIKRYLKIVVDLAYSIREADCPKSTKDDVCTDIENTKIRNPKGKHLSLHF